MMFMVLKKIYLLLFLFIFSSACTTVYKPEYTVIDKLYKPKKKLVVEVDVYKKYRRSKNVLSNDALTRNQAYQQGVKYAGDYAQTFCSGPFDILRESSKQDVYKTSYTAYETVTRHRTVYDREYNRKKSEQEETVIPVTKHYYRHRNYKRVVFQCR